MEYLIGPPGKGGCGYRPGRVATGGPARLATSWNSSASSQTSTWLLLAFTHRGLAKEGSASIAGADGRDFDGLLLFGVTPSAEVGPAADVRTVSINGSFWPW